MRPSPQEVRMHLAGTRNDDECIAYLTALRADPNWRILFRSGRRGQGEIVLAYFPTGELVVVPARRR